MPRQISLWQVALHFALRSAMLESRAVDADALNQTLRLARFVRRVVKRIFERRRADIDDENFLRPLALELESVRIVALSETQLRFRWIRQNRFHPLGDGSRDVLHRLRLGDNDRLKERYRNKQHLAARLGDEVGEDGSPVISAFSERLASLQLAQWFALAIRHR